MLTVTVSHKTCDVFDSEGIHMENIPDFDEEEIQAILEFQGIVLKSSCFFLKFKPSQIKLGKKNKTQTYSFLEDE
jgi:hypothetical protein